MGAIDLFTGRNCLRYLFGARIGFLLDILYKDTTVRLCTRTNRT